MKKDQATPRSILEARARALALVAERAVAGREFLDVIEFRLAGETYGIESAFVREVHPLDDFTPLPGAPPFVLGIVNLRGRILSVVDLKRFFHLPEKGLGQFNKLIILRNDRMEFGILGDDILGARILPLDEVQSTPPTVTGIGAEYSRGVTADLTILLDAENILNDPKIIVHQETE